ncbi:MAG: hypothetical protein K2Y18_00745 [Alphaproteobacteria bacterium]|jgi:hypothetical protein|nr:hypothetical protein [Alphaproteobacteria bacterium]
MTHELLISEPPLQVLPTLAQTIGLNEAIVLQQVHYWLNPKFNKNFFENRYWVWNTYEQWQNQFPFWGMNTIRRAVANLEEAGLLMSFVTRDFKKLKYYTLDYEKLQQVFIDSETNSQKVAKKQGTHPSAQNGQIDLLKSTDRPAQIGQIDRPNLGRCINIDTETTSSENTLLPPLTPPSKNCALEKCHEEEEKINQIYFQMLDTWNKTIQSKFYCGKDVHLTEKRLDRLKTFLDKVLNGKINSWVDYCEIISKSRFLCGQNPSGFKVTLDWAIVPDNAYKLLEGVIYDKQENSTSHSNVTPDDQPWDLFSEEIARALPSSKHLQPWMQISLTLAKLIGQNKYRTWFSKVTLSHLTGTKAIFSVEGNFTKGYIANHFLSEVQCAVQSLFPEVVQIEFHVIPTLKGIA